MDETVPEKSIENKSEVDPYEYTKRNEFTSEIYKIEVMNIPLHSGFSEVRKLLKQRLKLKPNKIKVLSAKQSMYAFVNFRCEEDRAEAIEKINEHVWKNCELKAKKANPAADPFLQKRKLEEDNKDCKKNKKTKSEDSDLPVAIRLKNAVVPLWEMSYKDQLLQKENELKKLLNRLSFEIGKVNPDLRSHMKSQRDATNGLCCEFLGIKQSPTLDGYRNKCEFSIGYQPCEETGTEVPTIGFRLSRYSDGSITVAEPDECCHIDDKMKAVAKCFQNYIRQSDKKPYCAESHEGYWRQLTVRTSKLNQILVIIVVHPQDMTEPEIEEEKQKIEKHIVDNQGDNFKITSLYMQLLSKRSSGQQPPIHHIFGKQHIQEKLFDLTFNISPEAFFQVNTSGAEILYSTIGELSTLTKETTLLDVCCGTGTIGLCLANKVKKVMGVEMISSAVEDAKKNVQINGTKNAEFFCGKAEDIMNALIKRSPTNDIVAIVDPPRAGLHSRVVKTIRASPNIKKLIYVSCNPAAAKNNFIELSRPISNNFKGDPFIPVKAVAVDLFPHTPHCELVICFERS